VEIEWQAFPVQCAYCVLCSDIIQSAFPNDTRSLIRACIRQKLNNAEKVYKRKMAKTDLPGEQNAAM